LKKTWLDPRFAGKLFNDANFEMDATSYDFRRVEKGKLIKELARKKSEQLNSTETPAGFSKMEEKETEGKEEDEENDSQPGSPTLYELEDEADNEIALFPERNQILKKREKQKRKLLGERAELEQQPSKKVKIKQTMSFLPQSYIDTLSKKREESNKRHERNKTRRKANTLFKIK